MCTNSLPMNYAPDACCRSNCRYQFVLREICSKQRQKYRCCAIAVTVCDQQQVGAHTCLAGRKHEDMNKRRGCMISIFMILAR